MLPARGAAALLSPGLQRAPLNPLNQPPLPADTFFVYSFSFAFALGNLTSTASDLAKAAGAISRTCATLREVEGGLAGVAAEWPAEEQQQQQQTSASGPGSSHSSNIVDGKGKVAPGLSSSNFGSGIFLPELQGNIEFRGVSFRHPGWGDGWTLDDISFRLPAGQTVALVGPSGGGKTTIAQLLQGIYRPDAGEILVDGHTLASLDMSWWRRQLGVVAQDPGLMVGSVADIIRYGYPDAPMAEVEAAAAAAQASDFIAALHDGYTTRVGGGDGGVELSGGQAQRLAISRALLRRPRVLVLDEATSALDVETEGRVAAALAAAGSAGVTTLVIAHRLSTVRRADRVVVVAGGRVVEEGTHAELQRLGGMYARMVAKAERRGASSWGSIDSADSGSSIDESSKEAADTGSGDQRHTAVPA